MAIGSFTETEVFFSVRVCNCDLLPQDYVPGMWLAYILSEV